MASRGCLSVSKNHTVMCWSGASSFKTIVANKVSVIHREVINVEKYNIGRIGVTVVKI